jgi:hypothetical protein
VAVLPHVFSRLIHVNCHSPVAVCGRWERGRTDLAGGAQTRPATRRLRLRRPIKPWTEVVASPGAEARRASGNHLCLRDCGPQATGWQDRSPHSPWLNAQVDSQPRYRLAGRCVAAYGGAAQGESRGLDL